jgi:hypothetical protein
MGCRVVGAAAMNAARILRALEAIEDGERDIAVAILLDLVRDVSRPTGVTCAGCGQRFEWPGLRDAHLCPAAWERAA